MHNDPTGRGDGLQPAERDTPAQPPGLPEDMLIILPVRNIVLFPGVILPVAIKREKTVAGAQEAVRAEGKVGFLLQKDAETEDPALDDLHRIGTVASIVRYITAPDGTHHLVCQGERRFRVLDAVGGFPYLVARVEFLNDTGADAPGGRGAHAVPQAEGRRGDLAAAAGAGGTRRTRSRRSSRRRRWPTRSRASSTSSRPRSRRSSRPPTCASGSSSVSTYLTRRVEVLKLSRQIEEQTKEAIDDRQREFVLREQMKQIQKELGDESGGAGDRSSSTRRSPRRACRPTSKSTRARN